MRVVYRTLAFLIAALVMVQAAFVVYGDAGFGVFIEEGGVVDKATMEEAFAGGELPFPEMIGFMLHGMNGMMVIPAVALLLLIASFFDRVPRGALFALAVVALVVLQVTLGLMGHSYPALGALHGINALILFSTAVYTGIRASRPRPSTSPSERDRLVALR